MRTTRSVALLMALTITGLVFVPAAGSVSSTLAATDAEKPQSTGTNASVGTLMQASAADASNGIESELFETAYERADDEQKATLVSDRAAELEAKATALEAERAALKANRDRLSKGAYRSQLSRLTVQLAGLERSIERTEHRAQEVNVAEDQLATLHQNVTSIRQNTSTQAGPGVAAVARGVARNAPPSVVTGPPTDRGPDTTQSPGTGPDDRPSKGNSTDQQSGHPGNSQSSETTPAAPSNGNSNGGTATGSGATQGAEADN